MEHQDPDLVLLTDSDNDDIEELLDEILERPPRRIKRPSTTPPEVLQGSSKRRLLEDISDSTSSNESDADDSSESTNAADYETASTDSDSGYESPVAEEELRRRPRASMYRMGGKYEALPYMSVGMFEFLCERYEVEPDEYDDVLIKRHQKSRTKHVVCVEVEGTEVELRRLVEANNPGVVMPRTVTHDVLKEQAKSLAQLDFSPAVRNMFRRFFSSFNGRGSVVWYARYNHQQ